MKFVIGEKVIYRGSKATITFPDRLDSEAVVTRCYNSSYQIKFDDHVAYLAEEEELEVKP